MTTRAADKGFSLVELMIALTLSLIILAGLVTVFANTSRARAELQRSSEQIENGRYAIATLSEDLRLAGFFGELEARGLAVPGAIPDPCATDAAAWREALALHVQGYDNGAGVPACIPASLKPGTDVVTLRRVRGCIAGTAACDTVVEGQPYLQVSLCENSAASHTIGVAGSTEFAHTLADCATAAGLRRYLVNTYFISTDNGAGAAIPTLKRLEFNGAGVTEVPLAEGIERLEVRYGIDSNGDGSPEAFVADPSLYTYAGCTSCTAPNNWANVVAVEIQLLSRASEASPGYVDRKTYTLGTNDAGEPIVVGPQNDAYRRHVYVANVRLMNPSTRRERP